MRTVWLLLCALAARWKKRTYIAYFIVLIIVMISTFCYVKKTDTKPENSGKITLGVAQEDTSEYADLLMQYFNENETFLRYVKLIEAEEEKLENALLEGSLDGYLVIPKNFAHSMIQMENLPIKARVSMANPAKALILRHVTEAYENYVEAVEVNCTALYRRMKEEGFSAKELDEANVEISLELIFTALGKDDFFRTRMVETTEQQVLSYREHYRYTGIYFCMLFILLPAGLSVLSLRENGLLRRLGTVNVPACSVLTAVGFPYALFTVLLLTLICIIEQHPERILAAIVYILPWLFVFLLAGLCCKDRKQYLFLFSMCLICLAVLGGSLLPEEFLPDSFRAVAKWMPNRNFTLVMGGVQP